MLLKRLTQARGVSGDEGEVRNLIRKEIEAYVDEIKVDRIGNLIAIKRGKANTPKVMLAAHMDEVGLIITGITDNGMLKFHTVGGIDDRILVSKRVKIGTQSIAGVIGAKAIHLQERDERNKALVQKNLYIDIGAKSREMAEKIVGLGDYVVFDSSYVEFGEHRVKAKALDDRAGCALLIELLKESYDCTILAAFTVQEEVGLRGAGVAAYHLEPDLAVVVEGTTCSDVAGVEDHLQATRLGMGAVLSLMDRRSIAHGEMVQQLVRIAQEKNIPFQYKETTFGGNDAGKIHLSRGGIPTASVSIPCRYIHSPVSVMHQKDYDACLELLRAFLQEVPNIKIQFTQSII